MMPDIVHRLTTLGCDTFGRVSGIYIHPNHWVSEIKVDITSFGESHDVRVQIFTAGEIHPTG
jgi:hypothetical protein